MTDGLCPNCGGEVSTPFCGSCGQREGPPARSVIAYLRDVLEETISADGRLPRTLGSLLLRPGHLTQEWAKGRRKRYTHPLRLYLFAALLFFVMWPLSTPDRSLIVGSVTSLTADSGFGEERAALVDETIERLLNVLPLILVVLLVPALATASRVVLGRRGDFFETHLVFALHAHAVLFVLLVASQPLRTSNWIDDSALLVAISIFAVYVVLAARRTFARGLAETTLRTLLALVLYLVAFWATILVTATTLLGAAGAQ